MWDLRSRYLPALSGAMMEWGWHKQEPEGHTGKLLNFWTDDGFIDTPYKYMLVSAFYGLMFERNGERLFKDTAKISKDVYLLGDSGGFQAVSQNKILEPEKVINWHNRNCVTGLILDIPPYELAKKNKEDTGSSWAQFGAEKDFDGCLKKTLHNGTVMKKGQKELVNLFGVIQGNTKEKAVKWFKTLNHLDFEGWALAPKPSSDPDVLQWWLELAYEYLDDKPLHILQIGSPLTVAMVSRFCYKKYKGSITYDNSTPLKLATNYRGYMDRDGGNILLGKRMMYQNEKDDKGELVVHYDKPKENMKDSFEWLKKYTTNDGKLSCPCNVCRICPITTFQNIDSIGALYMALHNIQAYVSMHEYIKSICVDDMKLVQFFKRMNDFGNMVRTARPIQSIMRRIDEIGENDKRAGQKTLF